MKPNRSILKTLSRLFVVALATTMFSCELNSFKKEGNGLATQNNEINTTKNNIVPSDWEWNAALPDPCKEVCLTAGQHMYAGNVQTASVEEGVLVTYNITADDIYLREIHLDIFSDIDQFTADGKMSNGGAKLGKFIFQKSWDSTTMITSYTVLIPSSYIDLKIGDASCMNIVTHAVLSNGETAYGGICDDNNGVISLDNAKQFPGANWAVYFEFCRDECSTTIDFTYAWEDINEDYVPIYKNDADYNDLVFKSDLIKTPSQLNIRFLAVARGAAFNHAFKFRIPKQGIVNGADGIFGEASVTEDGDYFIVEVISNTKQALPPEFWGAYPGKSNTDPADTTCSPQKEVYIQIDIDNTFAYNPSFPYDPFITVYPGDSGEVYDLNIWELHQDDGTGSVWTRTEDGVEKLYPNGILIPFDWKWPSERQFITGPYPNFSNITDGWNPDWADYLADESLVWTCKE